VWVKNEGILPALGSFELDLSVTYYDYSQDPPLQVNRVSPTTTPQSTDVQPGGLRFTTFHSLLNPVQRAQFIHLMYCCSPDRMEKSRTRICTSRACLNRP
jgi:hypothetical protein